MVHMLLDAENQNVNPIVSMEIIEDKVFRAFP